MARESSGGDGLPDPFIRSSEHGRAPAQRSTPVSGQPAVTPDPIRRRLLISIGAAVVVIAVAAGAWALSSDPVGGDGPAADGRPEVVVWSWGGYSILPLANSYMVEHPDVLITVIDHDYSTAHEKFYDSLTGSGELPDVFLAEEDWIPAYLERWDRLANVERMGFDPAEHDFLPWRLEQLRPEYSSGLYGLPLTVEGTALCYRADLLEEAGLPSAREDVDAAVADDWGRLLDLGEDYTAATGRPFLDSSASLLWPLLVQSDASHAGFRYYGVGDPELVREPFDAALAASARGIGAGLDPYTDTWEAAAGTDAFAATVCHNWSAGYLDRLMGERADEMGAAPVWGIADLPGPGGSWGGLSALLPLSDDEEAQRQAYEFAAWLAEPEQLVSLHERDGALPARAGALRDPSVLDRALDEGFSQAPASAIFGQAALELPSYPAHLPESLPLRWDLEALLAQVDRGEVSADEARERMRSRVLDSQ